MLTLLSLVVLKCRCMDFLIVVHNGMLYFIDIEISTCIYYFLQLQTHTLEIRFRSRGIPAKGNFLGAHGKTLAIRLPPLQSDKIVVTVGFTPELWRHYQMGSATVQKTLNNL